MKRQDRPPIPRLGSIYEAIDYVQSLQEDAALTSDFGLREQPVGYVVNTSHAHALRGLLTHATDAKGDYYRGVPIVFSAREPGWRPFFSRLSFEYYVKLLELLDHVERMEAEWGPILDGLRIPMADGKRPNDNDAWPLNDGHADEGPKPAA